MKITFTRPENMKWLRWASQSTICRCHRRPAALKNRPCRRLFPPSPPKLKQKSDPTKMLVQREGSKLDLRPLL